MRAFPLWPAASRFCERVPEGGTKATAAREPGSPRPAPRFTVEALPAATASATLLAIDCSPMVARVLVLAALKPCCACVAPALISPVAGTVFFPPHAAARIVAAIKARRIWLVPPVGTIEHRPEEDATKRRGITDVNQRAGLRKSALRGGKVSRSENYSPRLC